MDSEASPPKRGPRRKCLRVRGRCEAASEGSGYQRGESTIRRHEVTQRVKLQRFLDRYAHVRTTSDPVELFQTGGPFSSQL